MNLFFNLSKMPLWFVITVAYFMSDCQGTKDDYTQVQGNAQGTTYSIKYESLKDYSREIDSIFKVIDLSMSTYIPQSLISKINNGDSTIVLDGHFTKVFNQSLQVYQESSGAFDPTVGVLVSAYGFGKEHETTQLDQKVLDSLMQFVGLNKLSIQNQKLSKTNPKIQIDFNAIAQGYTVDVIADFLKHQNISNYMVEVGGEVKASGVNPKGKPWTIGIQNPESKEIGKLETVINLTNKSVATSGNYRKFRVDENGKKFVHTINPSTGKAVPSDVLSASVVTSKDCAYADAYATTLMVMGFEKSLAFLQNHPELEVYLIYIDKTGKTQIYSTVKSE